MARMGVRWFRVEQNFFPAQLNFLPVVYSCRPIANFKGHFVTMKASLLRLYIFVAM